MTFFFKPQGVFAGVGKGFFKDNSWLEDRQEKKSFDQDYGEDRDISSDFSNGWSKGSSFFQNRYDKKWIDEGDGRDRTDDRDDRGRWRDKRDDRDDDFGRPKESLREKISDLREGLSELREVLSVLRNDTNEDERPLLQVVQTVFSKARDVEEAESAFAYGVASGDPDAESVVIWTHAQPVDVQVGEAVVVYWEVAEDATFQHVVDRGLGTTGTDGDYTFKAIADGLEAGGEYHYRFKVEGEYSDVGQMKTLPEGHVESIELAVFSCVNYPAGFFNAFDAAVENGFDYSVHLGDYIYEYGLFDLDGEPAYATDEAEALGRVPSPETEIVTFDDYVERYKQYTLDEDLQALRSYAPMIMMWDDHETANDSWETGAENHNDTNALAPEFGVAWEDRRDAALEAYFKWNPIREPESGDLRDHDKTYEFGDLADLHMLETRLQARDETRADVLAATTGKIERYLTGEDDFVAEATALNPLLSPADAAAILLAGRTAAATGNEAGLTEFQAAATVPALAGLIAEAQDVDRDMIGDAQMDDLLGKIEESDATWQIIGSQTLMARMELPADVLIGFEALAPLFVESALGVISEENAAILQSFDEQSFGLPFEVPYNFDSWDGYQAERQEILEALAASDSGGIVLAGDTHNAWASRIFAEPEGDERTLAAFEFAGPGVTSPGFEQLVPEVSDPLNPGSNLDYAAEAFLLYVDDLVFANLQDRGYMSVEITEEMVETDYVFLSTTLDRDYETEIVTQSVLLEDFV